MSDQKYMNVRIVTNLLKGIKVRNDQEVITLLNVISEPMLRKVTKLIKDLNDSKYLYEIVFIKVFEATEVIVVQAVQNDLKEMNDQNFQEYLNSMLEMFEI